MQVNSAKTPACLHEPGPVLHMLQHLNKLKTESRFASQEQQDQDTKPKRQGLWAWTQNCTNDADMLQHHL